MEPRNEAEPLVGVRSNTEADPSSTDQDDEPKSGWYLFILTLGIGGLQVIWSVQHSAGSLSGWPGLLQARSYNPILAFAVTIAAAVGYVYWLWLGYKK
ncbi:hypothetical protein EYZ11_001367 [Aspergillus tanneri]|uniref:Uncharacterized protein n=1 Tax=Aspergillus tanneri TaxID=1220188 RepID=A0A4S3JUV6_9EURO|nr:hypothetical protein EYZ11_001367 [Aspergillus tanneri]